MHPRLVPTFLLALLLTACAAVTSSPAAELSPSPAVTPPPGCINPPPDITTLIEQTDPVACYGNAPLTVDAYPIAGVVDCPGAPEPAWLGCPQGLLMLVGETRKVGAPVLIVAVDPASGISLGEHFNTNVRVTGHFDDSSAQDCRWDDPSPALGGTPGPASDAVELCRRTFVVTQVAPLKP